MAEVDLIQIKPDEIGKLERHRQMCQLEAYLAGTQYAGRPDFWSGQRSSSDAPVPLRERAPCVIDSLPQAIVEEKTSFTFGEGRFPTVKCEEIEADDAQAPGLTLSADEAETLSSLVEGLIESGQLKSTMRSLMRRGCSARTAVAVLSMRKGKLSIDIPHAKDCWPTFVDDDVCGDVATMVWCYQFQKLVRDENGQLVSKPHLFRRDYDDKQVRVYLDAPIEPNKDISWILDEDRSYEHKLGLCPVLWIRNLPEEYGGDIDGRSVYDGQLDEFDALNFALSQRHRGLVFFGTPQPWETDVEQGDGPGQPARTAAPLGPPAGWKGEGGGYRGEGAQGGPFGVNGRAGIAARPTGPDNMWSYRGPAKIGLLETTGKAFEVATNHVNDIAGRIKKASRAVLLDPTEVAGKGDMSAKALALMFAPLLASVDELRDCWWHQGLSRILSMAMRMIAKLGGKGILLPGAPAAAKILKRFYVTVDGGEQVWLPPKLTPVWGDYFSPSNEEIKLGVESAVAATTGGLVTKESGTRFLASYFGVEDVEAELEAQAEEAEEAMVKQAEQLGAETKAVVDAQPPPPPGAGAAPRMVKAKGKAKTK